MWRLITCITALGSDVVIRITARQRARRPGRLSVAAVEKQRAWLSAEIQKGLDSGPGGALDIEDVIRRGKVRLAARRGRRGTFPWNK